MVRLKWVQGNPAGSGPTAGVLFFTYLKYEGVFLCSMSTLGEWTHFRILSLSLVPQQISDYRLKETQRSNGIRQIDVHLQ